MLRSGTAFAARHRLARTALTASFSRPAVVASPPLTLARFCASDAAPRTRHVNRPPTDAPPPPPPGSEAGASSTAGASTARVRVDDPNPSDQPGAHVGEEGSYDPWAVLGLQKGASAHDIRVRYHDLMKQLHPSFADPETADLDKWNEIDRAHAFITQAPKVDSRYNLHIDENQRFYYAFLPEWMARNVDDRPRYMSWIRHRFGKIVWPLMMAAVTAMAGLTAQYPLAGPMLAIALLLDLLFATSVLPFIAVGLFLRSCMSHGRQNMAWLLSPKGFMQRGHEY